MAPRFVCVCVCVLLTCVRVFATPWTAACQALLSMNSPDKNTGVDCHFLLQGIFLTQALNPGLLLCRQILYHLSYRNVLWYQGMSCQLKKKILLINLLFGKILYTKGFPGGSDGKESACKAGDLGSILGSGISPGEGNGNPLQYSCLENPLNRGTWGCKEADTTEASVYL